MVVGRDSRQDIGFLFLLYCRWPVLDQGIDGAAVNFQALDAFLIEFLEIVGEHLSEVAEIELGESDVLLAAIDLPPVENDVRDLVG